VIISPIRYVVLVAMLYTLLCGYNRCTECQAILGIESGTGYWIEVYQKGWQNDTYI